MKVSELLCSPDKWCRFSSGKLADGENCSYSDPSAVAWDLFGAILLCYPESDDLIYKVQSEIRDSVMVWNDSVTYEDVMSLVRKMNL